MCDCVCFSRLFNFFCSFSSFVVSLCFTIGACDQLDIFFSFSNTNDTFFNLIHFVVYVLSTVRSCLGEFLKLVPALIAQEKLILWVAWLWIWMLRFKVTCVHFNTKNKNEKKESEKDSFDAHCQIYIFKLYSYDFFDLRIAVGNLIWTKSRRK